ncbi:MAG: hypothetical protein K0R58_1910 [Ramlibacter sp.]|jgi:hypothetical protein|nr:hypothetical protein [Ramlibacter sp.]
MKLSTLSQCLACAAFAAACASPFEAPSIAPGTAREQVVARMGPPTRVVPLPGGGERFQYSLQPQGRFAWMVDFDTTGRTTRSRQVLTAAGFERILPGQWTRSDVEREFGPPASIDRVTSWNGPVMTYRWEDVQRAPMFYWIYLDPQGVVQRAHPGMEQLDLPDLRI